MRYCEAREHEGIAMAWPAHLWLFLLRRELAHEHSDSPAMLRWDPGSRGARLYAQGHSSVALGFALPFQGNSRAWDIGHPGFKPLFHTLTKFSWLSSPNLKSSEQYNQ